MESSGYGLLTSIVGGVQKNQPHRNNDFWFADLDCWRSAKDRYSRKQLRQGFAALDCWRRAKGFIAASLLCGRFADLDCWRSAKVVAFKESRQPGLLTSIVGGVQKEFGNTTRQSLVC